MEDVVLRGARVLIVEDEDLIAALLEDLLSKLGCEVVATATTVTTATAVAGRDEIDVALLDVMMKGVDVHPVVEILARRGIAYAFVTGYGLIRTTGIYRNRPVLTKPITLPELRRVLREALTV